MRILCINGGSSSLKFSLREGVGEVWLPIFSGKIDHIGLPYASLSYTDTHGTEEMTEAIPTIAYAVERLVSFLEDRGALANLSAVAHRVVHGGHFKEHTRISNAVLRELTRLVPYDPDHLPGELALITALEAKLSSVPHIACFDTVFHRTIPPHAALLPIPRAYSLRGVMRYGFHGLSYEYAMHRLSAVAGPEVASGRVIIAHLGNGASLAAVHQGASVDTTMAMSPNSGIPMGTRSGDIDPGVIRYLATEAHLSLDEIIELLHTKSGLLGMSDATYDMLELLHTEDRNPYARETIDAFTHAVRKQIGAYAAVLGGVDALVFTGGMGENSVPIRARILEGLDFLGLSYDREKNTQGSETISASGSIPIYVIKTNEEDTMARAAARLIQTP